MSTKKDRLSVLVKSIQTQAADEPTWNDSIKSPAAYFLIQIVNLNKSLRYCMEKFPPRDRSVSKPGYKSIDKLTVEGKKVIHRLSAAAFVAMMGHFEIYQRSFVSRLFEATRFIRDLNIDVAMKRILGDSRDGGIRIVDIAAYRGQPANIGGLLTDNISGWHNPHRVNEIIKAMLVKTDFYSGVEIEYLSCLWQIRHSIAHTGGWLTLPDAQKAPRLKNIGDKHMFFDHNFVRLVHEEFHGIVKKSVRRAAEAFRNSIETAYKGDEDERERIMQSEEVESLFKVSSPREAELRAR